ncbi:multidrug effflux MFS transporter [Halobacillus salinarum]|uniref:Bcr/CflA family efflux transporter n=1 Tax=Halobacillus salinarum TaxID=2932257 RepID=A0ABY4EP99_9BACI|nr:multidrug effflux MFS transporter [Halobacillus salinarum]UOQ45464.1 multidrug effflux MFS transporter [Halobacillus salinarum]
MEQTTTLNLDKKSARIGMALLLGALTALGPLSIDMYLPALPKLTNDLHTVTSLGQASLTACLFGLAIGQVIFGSLSDAKGRRMPLVYTLFCYAAVSALSGFSPSIWILIVMRFLQGMMGAAGVVISRAVVRDLFDGSEMTKFFSMLMLVNGAAPVFAPIIGGQILRVTGWNGIFFVLGAVGLVLFFVITTVFPETLAVEKRNTLGIRETVRTFGSLFANRSFMGYVLSQSFIFAMMFSYISGGSFVIEGVFGASPQMFSIIFAVNGVGIVLATQVTGFLSGRVSDTRLLVAGLGLAVVSSLCLLGVILAGTGLMPVLVFLFFVVSSMGVVNTTGFSLAMQDQSQHAGSASALLGVIRFACAGIVAPFVGIAGSDTAVPMGILITLCALLGTVFYFGMVRVKKTA